MDRRTVLIGSVSASVAAMTLADMAQAQDGSAAVQKLMMGFEDALSSLDINKMMMLWVNTPDAVLINPRSKEAAVGHEAIKKEWEQTFAFWQSLKVSAKGTPTIRVGQNGGYRYATEHVEGKPKSGEAVTRTVLATTSFRKIGDKWLISLHHASNAPT